MHWKDAVATWRQKGDSLDGLDEGVGCSRSSGENEGGGDRKEEAARQMGDQKEKKSRMALT